MLSINIACCSKVIVLHFPNDFFIYLQTKITGSADSNIVVTLVGLDASQGYSISVTTSNAAGQGQVESTELERGKKILMGLANYRQRSFVLTCFCSCIIIN